MHHLISRGRGWKKIVCCHKSQKKKFVENEGRKKKFVFEIDEKYVDQKKHQMVTYIIGQAYDKKNDISFLRRNIKKLLDVNRQKKDYFLAELKKSNSNHPLPPPVI